MMRANSHDDILKSALALFAQKGYDAVSPNDVCALAGIKKPTLYHFFGSKEGLLEELLREQYGRLDDVIETACVYIPDPGNYENDVKPALIKTANALFDFATKNREFYAYCMALGCAPPKSVPAVVSERYRPRHLEILTGMFFHISGTHPNMGGREAAYAARFLALINSQIASWLKGLAELNETEAGSIVRGFLHGIYNR